jgi:ribose 5-phosphate isomerase B
MMLIYIGADHRGFNLKERIKNFLHGLGYEVADLGAADYEDNDDYTDFASAVARKVNAEPERDRGILICGSGVGMDIVANKFKGARSALALSADQIFDARHDDDVNILSLAADFTTEEDAFKIVRIFLETPFADEERYRKRIEKIFQIDNK